MADMKKYVYMVAIVLVVSYFANNLKQRFVDNEQEEEYELIRKYLLNESTLNGYNKTKLWVHTTYEHNSRKWKSFYSRNSTDLNEPYIHLTIKSIVNQCGDHFNICLIDDESFSKLIPSWDVDVKKLAEPFKSKMRELGLAQLIYIYGGIVVPNSFVCNKNLFEMFNTGTNEGKKPFVCEKLNRTTNLQKETRKMLFVPDTYFMGAVKKDPVIKELVDYLKIQNKQPHFSREHEFLGETSQWLLQMINENKINLLGGELVGVKTNGRKPILLEDLMEENYLDLHPNCYGVYIPNNELLSRTKYQWFVSLSGEEILHSNIIISKLIGIAMIPTNEVDDTNNTALLTP
jgi:hypothetical protein